MRRILCLPCGCKPEWKQQHPEDEAAGFSWRWVAIPHAKKPADLRLIFNGQPQPLLASLKCDSCDEPIPEGSPIVAVSQWRGGEMPLWEVEYSLTAADGSSSVPPCD